MVFFVCLFCGCGQTQRGVGNEILREFGWLWNRISGKYEYCPAFYEIENPEIDAEYQLVRRAWRNWAASHSWAIYRYVDGEFVVQSVLTEIARPLVISGYTIKAEWRKPGVLICHDISYMNTPPAPQTAESPPHTRRSSHGAARWRYFRCSRNQIQQWHTGCWCLN